MRVLRHESVPSTNELALRGLELGELGHGDVVTARIQTAGRGSRGRGWTSAAGGLYFSLVWSPPPPFGPPPAWTVAAGLGLFDGLRALEVPGLALKWPNDVLAGGAKLAGILVEARGNWPSDRRAPTPDSSPSAAPGFVIGVGLNVLQTSFPAELTAERTVTSLALAGLREPPPAPQALLEQLLPALRARLERVPDGATELAADYVHASHLDRGDVRLVGPGGEDEAVVGRLEAFELERGVRVRSNDGALAELPLAWVRVLATADKNQAASSL